MLTGQELDTVPAEEFVTLQKNRRKEKEERLIFHFKFQVWQLPDIYSSPFSPTFNPLPPSLQQNHCVRFFTVQLV